MSALAVITGPADHELDDRDLVARVRAGDDRAFETLYLRYQPRIGAYVGGMVRDHGRAEDVTQEVFMSALRRMRAAEGEIAFKPWIYEIAKNACIDAYRRGRNTVEVSFDAHDAIGADDHGRLAEPGARPETAVEGKLAIDNLCGAFGGLSQVHHDVLVLREFEGLTYLEIGERLGMSTAAVESTLFRARKRLTEEYEELVSGERCRRVQRLVDAGGVRAAGLRDRRRMARHLAHCQPCRRYARLAATDFGEPLQPATPARAAVARVAAFLPLPAFLQRQVAAVLDPGALTGWSKVAATVATVAVAGIGAGTAIKQATGGPAPAPSAPLGTTPGAARHGAPAQSSSATSLGRGPAATRAGGTSAPPATLPAAGEAQAPSTGAPPQAERPRSAAGAVGGLQQTAAGASQEARSAIVDATRRVVGRVLEVIRAAARRAGVPERRPDASLKGSSLLPGAVTPAGAGAGAKAGGATARGDSVSSTVSERITTTTAALKNLGG